MFKQKTYKVSCPDYKNEYTSVHTYGLSNSNINTCKPLADALGKTWVSFLRECGCASTDAWYDEEKTWIWIFGIPFLICANAIAISGNAFFASLIGPFSTTVFLKGDLYRGANSFTNAIAPISFLFDTVTKKCEFTFRFIGEPSSSFMINMCSYVTGTKASGTSAYPKYTAYASPMIGTGYLSFSKARNLLSGLRTVMVFAGCNAAGNTGLYPFDINESGDVIDLGYKAETPFTNSSSYDWQLSFSSSDVARFPNKIILRKLCIKQFEYDGVYMYPMYSGLPSAAAYNSDVQPFVTIDGETFWIGPSNCLLPVVRIITG